MNMSKENKEHKTKIRFSDYKHCYIKNRIMFRSTEIIKKTKPDCYLFSTTANFYSFLIEILAKNGCNEKVKNLLFS